MASQWMNDKPFQLAAALAYYTLFSLAPLLVVASVAAQWLPHTGPRARWGC
jgi:uncharacterized BrkB/YihY/UPF0761 family membrane protein